MHPSSHHELEEYTLLNMGPGPYHSLYDTLEPESF